MTAIPEVTDTSTLGLRPFFVKRKGDRYTVISREGRQAISTTKAGVEAIRLLSEGRTVEHTKGALGRRYGHLPHEIDLAPLLGTLFASGFVRTLDGRDVTTASEPAPHGLKLWLTLFVWSPLLELALRHLPPRRALPLAYRWFAGRPNPDLERRIRANLRLAPDLERTAANLGRIAAGNAQALRKHFCDRLLLTSVPPARLRRWLGEEVRVSGLEHLARARASGKGTILCSFHMGSYGLIPFVLGARGAAVTVYAGFGGEARADVAAWLLERARSCDAYPVRIVGGGMGLRALAGCLEQGETVLLYCDPAPGDGGPSRGRIKVPFLGTTISCPRGVGWLHLKTGASLLPVVLLWEGRGSHHLRIDPEVTCHDGIQGSNDVETVVTAAYGALERYVRQDPAQWLRWADFGNMIERDGKGRRETEGDGRGL